MTDGAMALVERLREMGEHPCRSELPMGKDLRQAADLIEQLEREKAVVSDLWEQQKEIALGYLADCNKAADRIEALEGKVERLRFHLDTALEALIMEGVCDGECGACKEARAELINPNKGDQ